MSIAGKVVIITGASSGIGESTARLLARKGATVILAARREDELRSLEREIASQGGKARAIPTDVTLLQEIERLVRETQTAFGRIDVLVNNAGVTGGTSLLAEDAVMARAIAVNLLAPAHLMKAVIPVMLKQRGGMIVNIGSMAGEIGVSVMYSASKFGLRGLNDAVRREFMGRGIKVTLIEPGFIRTPMTAQHQGKMPGPEVVARAVLRAVERPRRKIIVPSYYRIPLVFSALFPGLTDWLINERRRRSPNL